MNAAVATALAFVVYFIGYQLYGSYLAEQVFELDDAHETPAHTMTDGVDYVPTRSPVLFGHHYASIAGLAPMLGGRADELRDTGGRRRRLLRIVAGGVDEQVAAEVRGRVGRVFPDIDVGVLRRADGRGLDVDHAQFVPDAGLFDPPLDFFLIAGSAEAFPVDPEFGEHVLDEMVRPSVQRFAVEDVLAGIHHLEDRGADRRHREGRYGRD
jgi:hypothetical protein